MGTMAKAIALRTGQIQKGTSERLGVLIEDESRYRGRSSGVLGSLSPGDKARRQAAGGMG